jgi:prophage regulatory protein
MDSKSYRPKQAAELLGIGTATLWRWIKERPGFPQPIRLSARCTVLAGDQLIAWRDGPHHEVPKAMPVPKALHAARSVEPVKALAGAAQ